MLGVGIIETSIETCPIVLSIHPCSPVQSAYWEWVNPSRNWDRLLRGHTHTNTDTTAVLALIEQKAPPGSNLGQLRWFRVQPSYVRVLSSGHGSNLGQLILLYGDACITITPTASMAYVILLYGGWHVRAFDSTSTSATLQPRVVP